MDKKNDSKIEFSQLPFTVMPSKLRATQMGLIVLETDLTIESEMHLFLSTDLRDTRAEFSPNLSLLHTRIPCADNVSPETLSNMEKHFSTALALFPNDHIFDVVGYGCTSATLVIGEKKVEELVKSNINTKEVTTPLTAAKAALKKLGSRKIGYLAPYISSISEEMCNDLSSNGFDVSVAATFGEDRDSIVGLISPNSIFSAIENLVTESPNLDAIFISCTSLKCQALIHSAEQKFRVPVISSNSALAWHMAKLAELNLIPDKKGRLFSY